MFLIIFSIHHLLNFHQLISNYMNFKIINMIIKITHQDYIQLIHHKI